MPRWKFHITARLKHASAVYKQHERFVAERDADTCSKAVVQLLDEFEYITVLSAALIPDKPKTGG